MAPSNFPSHQRRALFTPLDPRGRVDAVEQRLVDAIQLGLLGDGEQLPRETELAARLGVATVTLREALASLRRQGLVETRRGRGGGSFVRAPSGWARTALQERFSRQPVDHLRDAGDLREAFECATARLAAERHSGSDLERLQAHVDALAGASTDSDRRRADARFHVELAAAARSSRLAAAVVESHREVGPFLWFALEPGDPLLALTEHRAILEAVADRDAERARRLASEHVSRETRLLVARRLSLTAEAAPQRSGRGKPAPLEQALPAALTTMNELVNRVQAGVADVRDAVVRLRERLADPAELLSRSQLDELRTLLHQALDRTDGLIVGTGMVFAPDVLSGLPRWLEWWCSSPGAAPTFLDVDLSPESPDFYDYEAAEWYATPRTTGERWLAGPFVDSSGTGQHIFTLTLPVVSRDRFLGVAGADMSVGHIGGIAERALTQLAVPAIFVNSRGLVIASNTPDWLVGTRWKSADGDAEIVEGPGWHERPHGVRILRDATLPWAAIAMPAGASRSPRR